MLDDTYTPLSLERLEQIAGGNHGAWAVSMARELIARREWARAAHQFMWAHEHGCPRRDGGACNCGLDTFLCCPREFVESYKAEVERLCKDRDAMFMLIGKMQNLESAARNDENRPIGVQMALADLWMWREKQTAMEAKR